MQLLASDTSDRIQSLVQQQRQFFNSGKTRDVNFRIAQLTVFRQAILDHQDAIVAAVSADLRKPHLEGYIFELAALREVSYALKHIRSWVKPKKVRVPAEQRPGTAKIYSEPLGVVLIISPWNYPFQLMISPLVGAIAAGNCALLKPSEHAPESSRMMAEIIEKTFDPSYIAVVEGGVEVSQAILAERFDHIFFTGGTEIGKAVMAAAAKHLTPVTLELGGKTPCIVDSDTDLTTTAKRIAWGKFVNAGQTCVAPDYLLVHRQIKPALLDALSSVVKEFYGDDPEQSKDFARLISDRHFKRVSSYLNDGKIVIGGQTNAGDRYIAPTVLDQVSPDAPSMQEEIFGPILPMLEYESLNEAIAFINARPKPLALYVFSKNQEVQQRVLQETSSGGVCINDTLMHLGVDELPFGGVGDSGIGNYHGKASFDTFSHQKGVLQKPFWLDLPFRYAPYTDKKLSMMKRFLG